MVRAETGSTSVPSCRADDRPQITPAMYWLWAVIGLMIVPAAKAETARGTRTSRVMAWTRTSTKWAPKEREATSLRPPAPRKNCTLPWYRPAAAEVVGPPRGRRGRKTAVAQPPVATLDVDAERAGDRDGHRGVCPRADLMPRQPNGCLALRRERQARRRGGDVGRVAGRSAAIADQPV